MAWGNCGTSLEPHWPWVATSCSAPPVRQPEGLAGHSSCAGQWGGEPQLHPNPTAHVVWLAGWWGPSLLPVLRAFPRAWENMCWRSGLLLRCPMWRLLLRVDDAFVERPLAKCPGPASRVTSPLGPWGPLLVQGARWKLPLGDRVVLGTWADWRTAGPVCLTVTTGVPRAWGSVLAQRGQWVAGATGVLFPRVLGAPGVHESPAFLLRPGRGTR